MMCSNLKVKFDLINQVREAKIKVFASLKQSTDEERSEWKELSVSLKVELILLLFGGKWILLSWVLNYFLS